MWTGKDIKTRDNHLMEWLRPATQDHEAGKLANTPYREIALELEKEFPGKTFSERTVQRLIQELREKYKDIKLQTLKPGRRKKSDQAQDSHTRADTIEPAKPIRPPGIADAIWQELLVLTGVSRSRLYDLLAASQGDHAAVGRRTSFMQRMRDLGDAVPEPDGIKGAGDDWPDGEHTLRLHQVVLEGPPGELRVILLAYDTRTHYINARLLVLLEKDFPHRRGPRHKRLSILPRSAVQKIDERWQVRLPYAMFRDFVFDTDDRMRLMLYCLLLHSSLGSCDDLIANLRKHPGEASYEALPPQPQRLPPTAFQEYSAQELGERLAAHLRKHNSQVATPLIKKAQIRLEHLRQAAANPDETPLSTEIYLDILPHPDGRRPEREDIDVDEAARRYAQTVLSHFEGARYAPSMNTLTFAEPIKLLYELPAKSAPPKKKRRR